MTHQDQQSHSNEPPSVHPSSSSTTTTTTTKNVGVLPINPDREKMSRALGAAFLQHKVQQLERNLDDLSFKRDLNLPTRPPQHHHHHHQQQQQRSAHPHRSLSSRTQSAKKIDRSNDQFRKVLSSDAQLTASSSKSIPSPVPIKVIDTSVLIYALPLLKKWVREKKFKIVIPLDVISELDFLKNSPPPIHGLVREATCWLDSQFRNNHPQQLSQDAIDQPCFIPQRTGDESCWDELSQKFVPPPLEVARIPMIDEFVDRSDEEDGEGEEEVTYRQLIPTDVPQRFRSLFQCALFYQLRTRPQQVSELVIFFPDHDPDPNCKKSLPSPPESNGAHDQHPEMDPEENSEGPLELSDWASRFQLKIHKVYPADLSHARQWLRNQNEKQKPKNHHASYPKPPQNYPQHHHHHHQQQRPTALEPSSQPYQIIRNHNRVHGQSSGPKPSSSSVEKQLFVW